MVDLIVRNLFIINEMINEKILNKKNLQRSIAYIFESKSRENKSNVRYETSCELIQSYIIVNRMRTVADNCKI